MSYQKTTWQTGDVITAEKLNNIEEWIENIDENDSSSGTFYVDATTDFNEPAGTFECTTTVEELVAALDKNMSIILRVQINQGSGNYFVVPMTQISQYVLENETTFAFTFNSHATISSYGGDDKYIISTTTFKISNIPMDTSYYSYFSMTILVDGEPFSYT